MQSNPCYIFHLAALECPEPDRIPNLVLIGLPNKAALMRALEKLNNNHIPHFAWTEPDYDFGLTAIATVAISGVQRKALANYKLWKDNAGGVEKSVAGFDANPCAIPAGGRHSTSLECGAGTNF